MRSYCESGVRTVRRWTVPVRCGALTIGGNNPIRLQSMTTSLTQDVDESVRQCIRLAEAGCEIIRLTAPNKAAAQALKAIRERFSGTSRDFCDIPLVADIHFLPSAAMEAVEHVEKIRVNPGNYADKKKFQVREYSDSDYELELERLHEAFSPLVLRCKELGRCLRIGTNHGSLSDRIMNRYGDTPHGMVESAMEFIRIAEGHGFRDIVLSMKASNPKVMVQAYRLAVARMLEEGMHYPLHLGVTEAGEGEDARIKSAIGIGSLLYDGLGDTIRVSLTEDPWFELPVCRDIAERAQKLWELSRLIANRPVPKESVDPYNYERRQVVEMSLGDCRVGPLEPPRVIVPVRRPLRQAAEIRAEVQAANGRLREARAEGLLVTLKHDEDCAHLEELGRVLSGVVDFIVVDCGQGLSVTAFDAIDWPESPSFHLVRSYPDARTEYNAELIQARFERDLRFLENPNLHLVVDAPPGTVNLLAPTLKTINPASLIFTLGNPAPDCHPVGALRQLAETLRQNELSSPLWIRVRGIFQILPRDGYQSALIEASMFAGTHFLDGYGDFLSIETVDNIEQSTALAYNLLQGARMRSIKTEFVACPSCGRTLFNLQEVTQRIKNRTGHLKGVTIAVMGCIVNGPGEMADADFGYVGGAPGKVNLYVGKQCVQFNIPEDEALDRLVDLIREHGKWVDNTASTELVATVGET